MKLKRCKSCGKEIAKNARFCPHCGHKYSRVSGYIAYTLIFIVIIFMLSYDVSNLSNSKNNHNFSLSINQLAQNENARVGKYLTMYRANTEIQNSDGSFIILNFLSIKKYQTYHTNNNQSINNVIVVENVTDISTTKNFVRELAYLVLFKNSGEEINITNGIYTQNV